MLRSYSNKLTQPTSWVTARSTAPDCNGRAGLSSFGSSACADTGSSAGGSNSRLGSTTGCDSGDSLDSSAVSPESPAGLGLGLGSVGVLRQLCSRAAVWWRLLVGGVSFFKAYIQQMGMIVVTLLVALLACSLRGEREKKFFCCYFCYFCVLLSMLYHSLVSRTRPLI